jgi:hypothetical protein
MIVEKELYMMFKTKTQIRQETEAQVKAFLRTGGSIEVVKAKKAPAQKMMAKSSRGFVKGSSGFATGFPKSYGV